MTRLDSNSPPAAADGDPGDRPDPASPPPPPPPSAVEPLLLALPITTAPTGGGAKKAQPVPWTPQETAHLIQAYQEKWYSLKRGPLKAFQWEEVAITVAARCGYDDPSKTATQCRHKLEKLRKRYRSEKKKKMLKKKKKKKKTNHHLLISSPPPPPLVCWQFFHLMDHLERGPLPISARPPDYATDTQMDVDDDDDDDEDFGKNKKMLNSSTNRNYCSSSSKSRSINYILRKPSCGGGGGGGGGDGVPGLRNPMFRRPKKNIMMDNEEDETDDDDDDDDDGEPETGGFFPRLASEIRKFAQRFSEIEGRKMELMRETERYRMEMEGKRTEMILQSQKRIVDTISRAVVGGGRFS